MLLITLEDLSCFPFLSFCFDYKLQLLVLIFADILGGWMVNYPNAKDGQSHLTQNVAWYCYVQSLHQSPRFPIYLPPPQGCSALARSLSPAQVSLAGAAGGAAQQGNSGAAGPAAAGRGRARGQSRQPVRSRRRRRRSLRGGQRAPLPAPPRLTWHHGGGGDQPGFPALPQGGAEDLPHGRKAGCVCFQGGNGGLPAPSHPGLCGFLGSPSGATLGADAGGPD